MAAGSAPARKSSFGGEKKILAFQIEAPILRGMSKTILRYRGRDIGPEEVEFIRQLIAQHPHLSRRRLSVQLCQAWNWVQPNGAWRDMVCRGLMLALHRGGWIQLPAPMQGILNNVTAHRRRRAGEEEVDQSPIVGSLKDLGPLKIEQVRRSQGEDLWAQLLAQHHYLGYSRPVGEHLKYLVWAQGRAGGCPGMVLGSAPLGPAGPLYWLVDPQRKAGLHLLAYNTRFLIMPWVRVRASGQSSVGALGPSRSAPTGKQSINTQFIGWRHSLIRRALPEPVTGRPTGLTWGRPPVGDITITPTAATNPASNCGPIRSRLIFVSCSRKGHDERHAF